MLWASVQVSVCVWCAEGSYFCWLVWVVRGCIALNTACRAPAGTSSTPSSTSGARASSRPQRSSSATTTASNVQPWEGACESLLTGAPSSSGAPPSTSSLVMPVRRGPQNELIQHADAQDHQLVRAAMLVVGAAHWHVRFGIVLNHVVVYSSSVSLGSRWRGCVFGQFEL